MISHLLLAIVTGILAGTVTGIIPGIHVNLISVILISLSPLLLNHTSPYALALFIIAMSITHTFLDIIPSIFLGAPNDDTALAVLPGHKLVLEGKGYEAIRLATIGSLLSLLFGILVFPALIFIVPRIYTYIQPVIGYLLVFVVLFLLLRESTPYKAGLIFLISGILGYTVLQFPNLHNPLFPLLSGIFGISILINSLFEEAALPTQYITDQIHLGRVTTLKSIGAASLSGWLTSMFPGIGPAHAAIISKTFFPSMDSLAYIVVIGGINTVNFLFSLVTFYTINKARNGAVIAIQELTNTIPLSFLLIIVAAVLLIAGLATLLTLTIAKCFAFIMNKINYQLLCITIIISILFLTIYLSNLIGLFILIISTALGLFTHVLNVKKSHAMGCLLLPVIIFFLF